MFLSFNYAVLLVGWLMVGVGTIILGHYVLLDIGLNEYLVYSVDSLMVLIPIFLVYKDIKDVELIIKEENKREFKRGLVVIETKKLLGLHKLEFVDYGDDGEYRLNGKEGTYRVNVLGDEIEKIKFKGQLVYQR